MSPILHAVNKWVLKIAWNEVKINQSGDCRGFCRDLYRFGTAIEAFVLQFQSKVCQFYINTNNVLQAWASLYRWRYHPIFITLEEVSIWMEAFIDRLPQKICAYQEWILILNIFFTKEKHVKIECRNWELEGNQLLAHPYGPMVAAMF